MNDHQHGLLYEIGSWFVIGAIITGIVYIIASPLGLVLALFGVERPFHRAGDVLLHGIAWIALLVALVMFFGIAAALFGFLG